MCVCIDDRHQLQGNHALGSTQEARFPESQLCSRPLRVKVVEQKLASPPGKLTDEKSRCNLASLYAPWRKALRVIRSLNWLRSVVSSQVESWPCKTRDFWRLREDCL